jgi:hypothetical protein
VEGVLSLFRISYQLEKFARLGDLMKVNMKIAPLLILPFFLALSLSGCGLYVVKKSSPAGDPQGIPFYVKTAGCQRQIVRLKPYYLLTLTTKTGDKTGQSESTTLCGAHASSGAFETLLDEAQAGKAIASSWTAVKKLACNLPEEPSMGSKDWFVTSDTISTYTYVDYQNPYSLNVRRPIMGSASATTKLAADGTLTEGTAQVEDKTGEILLGMIPTTALAEHIEGGSKPGVATLPYELKIEDKDVKFTWTYRDPATHGACEKDAQLLSDPPNTGKPDLVIEAADSGENKAADDGSTVKVTGSIQLPKAKDSATPAKP